MVDGGGLENHCTAGSPPTEHFDTTGLSVSLDHLAINLRVELVQIVVVRLGPNRR